MKNFLFLGFFFLYHSAFAALDTQCFHYEYPTDFNACITKSLGSTNPDLIYFFHGSGGNAHSWIKGQFPIYEAWERQKKDAPTVITFSFGRRWAVMAEPFWGHSLEEPILKTIIPMLEKSAGFDEHSGKRMAVGRSLGGLNAAYLTVKHPELFSKVALLSAAIPSISPHSSVLEIESYISRTGAKQSEVFLMMAYYDYLFPTRASWKKASPLEILKNSPPPNLPPMLVISGDHDEYGLFEGDFELAEILKQKGFSVIWDPLLASHFAMDDEALSRFLVP